MLTKEDAKDLAKVIVGFSGIGAMAFALIYGSILFFDEPSTYIPALFFAGLIMFLAAVWAVDGSAN